MAIYGSYMFEFSVSKDTNFFFLNNNDKRRISGFLLALCLTLIVKELLKNCQRIVK